MLAFKRLTLKETKEFIESGEMTIAEIVRIQTTPKKYIIVCPYKIYATDNIHFTLRDRLIKEYPNIEPENIYVINAKEYQDAKN